MQDERLGMEGDETGEEEPQTEVFGVLGCLFDTSTSPVGLSWSSPGC